jgi:hypothetical protein
MLGDQYEIGMLKILAVAAIAWSIALLGIGAWNSGLDGLARFRRVRLGRK